MATFNLDANDLASALAEPGLIREDVLDMVYNLDEGIPTPFTDMARTDSHSNVYSEWPEEDLAQPDPNNAVVDGSDATGNDTKLAERIGNRNQLSDKVIKVSDTSELVDSVASIGTIARQTSKRYLELRRDLEAIHCGRQGSQVDNGDDTPGLTGALGAVIKTNTSFGTGGAAGGFDPNTKIVSPPTVGEARALAWETVRDQLLNVYDKGGYPSVLMSVPKVIRSINSFLFSSAGDPYRAVPTGNVQGTSPQAQAAQGWITVVLSDFGISLSLVDNRLQRVYASADGPPQEVADVFICDPRYVGQSLMGGYRTKELGTKGHSEERLIAVNHMLKVYREDAHAMIADISTSLAVTAQAA